jgi:hypothetical protein
LSAMPGEPGRAIVGQLDVAASHDRSDKAIALGVRPSSLLVEILIRGVGPELGEAQEAAEEVALGGGLAHDLSFTTTMLSRVNAYHEQREEAGYPTSDGD